MRLRPERVAVLLAPVLEVIQARPGAARSESQGPGGRLGGACATLPGGRPPGEGALGALQSVSHPESPCLQTWLYRHLPPPPCLTLTRDS